MKPEDLKHNNYLQFLGKPVRVKGYYFMDRVDGVFWIKTDDYVDSKNIHFKPIPLTEEWLTKHTDFEHDDDFGNWHLAEYKIYSLRFKEAWYRTFLLGVKDYKVYWYNDASDDFYSSVKELPFVHKLQNLYKALTNQELKIIEQ